MQSQILIHLYSLRGVASTGLDVDVVTSGIPRESYVTGYRQCERCGRLVFLYTLHRVISPVTCRRVFGRGPLGECRGRMAGVQATVRELARAALAPQEPLE